MTKQTTILLGSILLLTAAMASAQTSQKVIVSVPFPIQCRQPRSSSRQLHH